MLGKNSRSHGKVGILSAAPLSLPLQELNIKNSSAASMSGFLSPTATSSGRRLKRFDKTASLVGFKYVFIDGLGGEWIVAMLQLIGLNASIFCNRDIVTKTTSSDNTNGSSTNFAGISAVHTRASCYSGISSAHVSENASETQIDTTMTFTVLIVSIEQNEEFQESRVHYTLVGIRSLLKIGEGGSLTQEGGFRNPWNPPLATPLINTVNTADGMIVAVKFVGPKNFSGHVGQFCPRLTEETSLLCMARFKRRILNVPNLITIWVESNY